MPKDGWLYRQEEIYHHLDINQGLSIENIHNYLTQIKTAINKKCASNWTKLRLFDHIDRVFVRASCQLHATITVINETKAQSTAENSDLVLLQVLYDVLCAPTTKWPTTVLLALLKKKSIKMCTPGIDDLNDHCLLTIFRQFNFNGLVTLAEVSPKWYRIAQLAVGRKLIIMDYQLVDKVLEWLRYDSHVSALLLEKSGNRVQRTFRHFKPTTACRAIHSSFFSHTISNITQLSISIRKNFAYFDTLLGIVTKCREQLISLSVWCYRDHKIDAFFRLHYPKLHYFCALGNLSVDGILTQFCLQNSHVKETNLALFYLDAGDYLGLRHLQNLQKIRFRLKIFADDGDGMDSGFMHADERSLAYNSLYNALIEIGTLRYLDIRWSNWHNDSLTTIQPITHFLMPHFTDLNRNIFNDILIMHNRLLLIANNMINLRVVGMLYEIPAEVLLNFVHSALNLEILYLGNTFRLNDDLYLSFVDIYRKRGKSLQIRMYAVLPVVSKIPKISSANVSADLLFKHSRIVSLTETRPFDIDDKFLYPFTDELLYPYDPIVDN